MAIPSELIRKRSYEIWQREGCRHGFDVAHWFRAKEELEAENQLTNPVRANGEYTGFVLARPAISRPPRKLVSQRLGMNLPNPLERQAAVID
jgi:hypothetical protein